MKDPQADLNEKWRDMDAIRADQEQAVANAPKLGDNPFSIPATMEAAWERHNKVKAVWTSLLTPLRSAVEAANRKFTTEVGRKRLGLHIESTSNLSLKEWK
jgi:hypothetical protein|tara:strand:- start:133 stop:435 length:303 start_codon:yes stop_codon:yes gene_type:complete